MIFSLKIYSKALFEIPLPDSVHSFKILEQNGFIFLISPSKKYILSDNRFQVIKSRQITVADCRFNLNCPNNPWSYVDFDEKKLAFHQSNGIINSKLVDSETQILSGFSPKTICSFDNTLIVGGSNEIFVFEKEKLLKRISLAKFLKKGAAIRKVIQINHQDIYIITDHQLLKINSHNTQELLRSEEILFDFIVDHNEGVWIATNKKLKFYGNFSIKYFYSFDTSASQLFEINQSLFKRHKNQLLKFQNNEWKQTTQGNPKHVALSDTNQVILSFKNENWFVDKDSGKVTNKSSSLIGQVFDKSNELTASSKGLYFKNTRISHSAEPFYKVFQYNKDAFAISKSGIYKWSNQNLKKLKTINISYSHNINKAGDLIIFISNHKVYAFDLISESTSQLLSNNSQVFDILINEDNLFVLTANYILKYNLQQILNRHLDIPLEYLYLGDNLDNGQFYKLLGKYWINSDHRSFQFNPSKFFKSNQRLYCFLENNKALKCHTNNYLPNDKIFEFTFDGTDSTHDKVKWSRSSQHHIDQDKIEKIHVEMSDVQLGTSIYASTLNIPKSEKKVRFIDLGYSFIALITYTILTLLFRSRYKLN